MSQIPPPPSASLGGSGYPVTVDFQRDYAVKRWSPLINWLLALPQVLLLYVLGLVWFVVEIVCFFTILFTKDIPDGLFGFQVMVLRYQWRVGTYIAFLRSEYPPFDFSTDPIDSGTDAARLSIMKPPEYHRFLPLIKWLLVLPHYVALIISGIALWVVYLIAFFAVLFTGRWPESLRDFAVGVLRWNLRVTAYAALLVDAYPPFSLH